MLSSMVLSASSSSSSSSEFLVVSSVSITVDLLSGSDSSDVSLGEEGSGVGRVT